jgi:hypothetical protein
LLVNVYRKIEQNLILKKIASTYIFFRGWVPHILSKPAVITILLSEFKVSTKQHYCLFPPITLFCYAKSRTGQCGLAVFALWATRENRDRSLSGDGTASSRWNRQASADWCISRKEVFGYLNRGHVCYGTGIDLIAGIWEKHEIRRQIYHDVPRHGF